MSGITLPCQTELEQNVEYLGPLRDLHHPNHHHSRSRVRRRRLRHYHQKHKSG